MFANNELQHAHCKKLSLSPSRLIFPGLCAQIAQPPEADVFRAKSENNVHTTAKADLKKFTGPVKTGQTNGHIENTRKVQEI